MHPGVSKESEKSLKPDTPRSLKRVRRESKTWISDSVWTRLIRVVKTVLLANRHFAWVTPAILVIFADFWGLRSKSPCFCGLNGLSEFSPIFVKTSCFRQGTKIRNGPNTVSESTVSNTELSEFFGPHRVPGRELSEFLSAYYLCAKENSPSFSQNSPSLP